MITRLKVQHSVKDWTGNRADTACLVCSSQSSNPTTAQITAPVPSTTNSHHLHIAAPLLLRISRFHPFSQDRTPFNIHYDHHGSWGQSACSMFPRARAQKAQRRHQHSSRPATREPSLLLWSKPSQCCYACHAERAENEADRHTRQNISVTYA
jgi:hypothetical protein